MASAKSLLTSHSSIANRSCSAVRIVLSATVFCALAVPALAAPRLAHGAAKLLQGASPNAGSAEPKPAREKKVYTNDDVASLRKNYAASTVGDPSPDAASPDDSSAPAVDPEPAREAVVTRRAPTPQLPPDQDPLWYAQQVASLSAQIADIDDQVQRLRNFRASDVAPGPSSPGLTVGLDIYAPTPAVSTDAHIQLLLQQRAELDSQISALADRAHANDISPDVLRRAPEIAQSASPAPTPKEQAQLTRERLQQLQSDLARVSGTQAAMHQEAAAQHTKLIPETKFGGGFTADFMKQLSLRKAAIQQQVSTVEDNARHEGVSPTSAP